MMQAFQEGGYGMWVILLLFALTTPLSVVGLIASMMSPVRRRAGMWALLAFASCVLIALVSLGFYQLGISNVFAAAASADPSSRSAVVAQGISEASRLIVFGVVAILVPFLALAVLGVRFMMLKSAPA